MPADWPPGKTFLDAWVDALAGDPVSAFGGVLIANREIDPAYCRRDEQDLF
jgi:AICAR transformylase/IMP cyclohydrolase PurH